MPLNPVFKKNSNRSVRATFRRIDERETQCDVADKFDRRVARSAADDGDANDIVNLTIEFE